jgi:hypothetical protein
MNFSWCPKYISYYFCGDWSLYTLTRDQVWLPVFKMVPKTLVLSSGYISK